jgi:outer membrane protein assembly factor BamD
LAKAKLAIADSYFKQGGTSNITQAIAAYKDFRIFFPFMPEAAYAQMQVAMAHYNQMVKADRDSDHARMAEEEFQTFLQSYPKDPLVPQAQQHLREVQEVLAEGQFRIGYYYYVKGDRRATAMRLVPLTQRYPLYSKSDTALWLLADVFEKSERKDIAGNYYGQIVRNYPLSKHAADAKAKLKAFGMPIPQPDRKAVEWMTAEQNAPRKQESLMHKPLGIFHTGPDIRMAAIGGTPQMEPESSTLPGMDVLTGGSSAKGTGAGKTGIVATVATGETPASGSPPATAASEDVNTAPESDSTNGATPAAPEAAAPATGDATAANPTATNPASGDPAKSDGSSPASNAAATDTPKADGTAPAANSQNQKESSSKKKGLRKLIPW